NRRRTNPPPFQRYRRDHIRHRVRRNIILQRHLTIARRRTRQLNRPAARLNRLHRIFQTNRRAATDPRAGVTRTAILIAFAHANTKIHATITLQTTIILSVARTVLPGLTILSRTISFRPVVPEPTPPALTIRLPPTPLAIPGKA